MTPADLLKMKMESNWEKFSQEELFRVFCLLVDQIEALEQQNKAMKKDIKLEMMLFLESKLGA
ncbi:MAG: hypothetical protein FWF59_07735 [Turicibacter sp.]|nr:hypothetical protein [Turicibacter sp.]